MVDGVARKGIPCGKLEHGRPPLAHHLRHTEPLRAVACVHDASCDVRPRAVCTGTRSVAGWMRRLVAGLQNPRSARAGAVGSVNQRGSGRMCSLQRERRSRKLLEPACGECVVAGAETRACAQPCQQRVPTSGLAAALVRCRHVFVLPSLPLYESSRSSRRAASRLNCELCVPFRVLQLRTSAPCTGC